MSAALDGGVEPGAQEPIALDGIAYGIDGLDALLAVHLGNAHVHGAFVREGTGLAAALGAAAAGRADAGRGAPPSLLELAAALRDTYRAAQSTARRVALARAVPRRSSRPPRENTSDLPEPVVTLEEGGRAVLLRRVRAYVVACAFDESMPLGMARLLSARLAAALAPELPLGDALAHALAPEHRSSAPDRRASENADALAPRTHTRPPAAAPGRSAWPPPARASWVDVDRTRRLLALVEARSPEPHVARLRVALRAGLTPFALEHLDALGADAMLLIEGAVEDILGLDRAALRRLT